MKKFILMNVVIVSAITLMFLSPLKSFADSLSADIRSVTVSDVDELRKALSSNRPGANQLTTGSTLIINVEPGEYYINSPLQIYSDTQLHLDKNSEIIYDVNEKELYDQDFIMIYNAYNGVSPSSGYEFSQNITISGGIWDANGYSKQNKKMKNPKSIMYFHNSKNISLKNTVIQNEYANHFVIFDAVNGLNVENVHFNNFYSYYKPLTEDLDGDVYDFYSDKNTLSERKQNIGAIEALHIDYDTSDIHTPCCDVTVLNCSFKDVPSGVGTHHCYNSWAENINIYNNNFCDVWFYCIHAANFRQLEVCNNTAENCKTLFRSEGSVGEVFENSFSGLDTMPSDRYDTSIISYGSWIQNGSNINFYNNIVDDKNNGTGISYQTSTAGIIKDNTISNCKEHGIFLKSASNIIASNNTIASVSNRGIYCDNDTVDVDIKDNTLYKCNTPLYSPNKNVQELMIKNNIIIIIGDADGNNCVDIRDAAFIARRVAQRKTDLLVSWSDYNNDGYCDIRDSAAIARDVARRKI